MRPGLRCFRASRNYPRANTRLNIDKRSHEQRTAQIFSPEQNEFASESFLNRKMPLFLSVEATPPKSYQECHGRVSRA